MHGSQQQTFQSRHHCFNKTSDDDLDEKIHDGSFGENFESRVKSVKNEPSSGKFRLSDLQPRHEENSFTHSILLQLNVFDLLYKKTILKSPKLGV